MLIRDSGYRSNEERMKRFGASLCFDFVDPLLLLREKIEKPFEASETCFSTKQVMNGDEPIITPLFVRIAVDANTDIPVVPVSCEYSSLQNSQYWSKVRQVKSDESERRHLMSKPRILHTTDR
jgi:hypothetical protein